jgi:cytochrome bd-type quinol oxidase subunit 1
MSRKTTSAYKRTQPEDIAQRPTAVTLATHILSSLIHGSLVWLVILVLGVTAFLYANHYQNDILLAMMFIGLVIMALVSGCRDWQNDLNEYQRHLALERHREQGNTGNTMPGYFTSRR